MRRLLIAALAVAAACGTRPDPQRLAAEKDAPRGEAGVVARRLLSEAQFNDHGYPTADGRFLSTTDGSTGDLAVRDLWTGALRRVGLKPDGWASAAYVETSIMSPDGRRIALAWADDESRYSIRVVDADGRNARVVYEDSAYYYMEVNGFAPDGRHVIVELDRTNGLFDYGWLDLDGGGIRLLFKDVAWVLGDVLFSPDGRYAAYNGSEEHPNAGPRDARILEIATGRTWPLLTWPSDESPNGWAPDGSAIVLSSDRGGTPGFWLQPVRDGRADGEARLLKPDAWNASGVGVARDGRLLYTVRTGAVYLYQATLDSAAGAVVGEAVRMDDRDVTRPLSALGVSRNGEWLVHNVPDRNRAEWGQPVLTLRSLLTGETRRVKTTLGRIYGRQHWSPDGMRVFTRGEDANRRAGVFVVDVTTGEARTVLLRDTTASSWAVPWNLGWTANGREVIYRRYDPDSTVRTVAADAVTGATRVLASWTHARPQDVIGELSPDGQLLAQVVPTEDRQGTSLRVTDLAGTSTRELLRVRMPDQLSSIDWAADGRHIYVVRANLADAGPVHPARASLRVDRVSVADGATRTLHFGVMGNFTPIAVHPDGRRLYFTAGHAANELWELAGWSSAATSARARAGGP
ncbi:MAG: translocation protein TolB [Geminicoccaceae bacterium]|nr:translocation protein TolB [Geminicoccaceae bacterium]